MYLKALEIQGFKSFPDRTRITFDEGITAVVGPNGSGKSNISDAVRWVLGETSVKQLRGNGKMEDVIFNGTSGRGAMGYSGVQLVLDNTDRRIDVDDDEVTIGRRYYRSGESEYSINGNSVRLRDVYEMLLDTGLGRDGYSIIGQGRIAEIVGAKSGERREIFEEASGIARFRFRKNQAERDLAAAEEKLVRAHDILTPMEEQMGPMERESIKTKKYNALMEEKKSLEVTLWVDTVRSTQEALRGQQRKIETATADYEAKEREIDRLDEETQATQHEIERINIEIEKANTDIRTLQEEVSGRDAKVAVLQNDIRHNEEGIEATKQEIEQSGDTAGEIEKEIDRHKEEIALAETRLSQTEEKIAVLEAQLSDIQQKSLSTGERRGQVQARLADITGKATTLKVSEATAESNAQSGQNRLAELEQSLTNVADELERLAAEKTDNEGYLAKLEAELTKLDNIRGGLDMKLQARQKTLAAAEEEERGVVREAENASHRLHMLRELENSLDGFQHSTKSVVKAGREGKLRGIIGPVSTLLSVKPGYEVAIETVLGYALQNVVVDGEAAAKAAMTFLKQTKGGRATFLPLDTVKPQRFDASRLPEGAITAKSVVGYDSKYENIVSSLLERIIVVESLNDISRVARALDYRNRIVSLDGQVANPGGSFTGGSTSRTTGLFSRKQEISDLQQKLAGMEQKKQAAAEATGRVRTEVDALSAELTATNSEAITLGEDKIRAGAEQGRIQAAMEAGEERRARRAKECGDLAAQIEEAQTAQKQAAREQADLAAEMEQLSEELTGIAGEDDGFLAQREALSGELSFLRMDAMDRKHDADLHRQNIETLKSRTGEASARREALLANIERMKAQNAEYEEKILAVGREAVDSKDKMTEMEGSIRTLTARRMEQEAANAQRKKVERTASDERENLGREVARLSEQKNTLEERYDNTVGQLWEEYELGLSEAEALCVPFESVTELRSRVADLRGKIRALGNVNPGAIEQFKELSQKYNTMKEKVRDVEESKARLEEMIAELSEEMTAIFSKSFAEINRNFGRIFAELFGGGRGHLSLSDPDDLLESGIDIEATPPGKDIKYLGALSGGEQALVAICIYFAILAVNPSPFCVLDEIEAALDDINVTRFAQYLRRISDKTQFIVITHRRGTMEEADVLYGVTMQEKGVSKMLRLNVAEVDATMMR